MTRRITTLLMAAGLMFAFGVAQAAPDAPTQQARFQKTKEFALKALAERIRILDTGRQCIVAANSPHALRECHEGAKGQREAMNQQLKPQLEHLKEASKR